LGTTRKKPGEASEDVAVALASEAGTGQDRKRRMVGVGLSLQAKRELLQQEAPQYRSASPVQKNERLETNVPGIYALGDVRGGPAFTHASYDDYRIVRTNLLEHGSASMHNRIVPHTVFIDPQLGRVGMTENEARSQGRPIRVAKLPMSAVARALETGETRGFMKAIVDAETGQILGCAILGVEGSEIMTIIQVARMGKLPYTALRDGIFTHPTLAEGLNALFMTLDA
jgi:pyruvate/2-oxoglutarate dehydrogenase complex dihydrolipoamide dehydrogenase (E3) component